jgi:hypothetical protein
VAQDVRLVNLETHKKLPKLPSPYYLRPPLYHVLHGHLVPQESMFPRMEPIPPTVSAHLAVPEHIPRLPTKIRAPLGQIAAPASTSLPTAQAAPTVFAHLAALENIPPPPTHSPAPLGQLALQAKR